MPIVAFAPALAQTPSEGAAADGRASTVLVLDVSNSMWGQVEGRSKIEIAREVIEDLLYDWDPAVDLGLVAYGHRRAGDCGDIEQVLPVGPVDPGTFSEVVNGLVPRGKTPLTDAVRKAAEILNYRDSRATVILVSDGIESCNADPCALAEELERGGVHFTAHVVGFDVARIEDQRELSCLAEATGGQYLTAESAGDLLSALRTVAAPPPPPMLRLEAVEEIGAAAITDSGLRWTLVDLDREKSILSGERDPAPELDVDAGRYFARAELGDMSGTVQFDYDGETDVLHQVVLSVPTNLDAPDTGEAGGEIAVAWTGPDAPSDFIALAEPGAEPMSFLAYARTSDGTPARLILPEAPGDYEIRYIGAAERQVLANAPILVVGIAATLDAAPVATAGADLEVAWTGPDNDGDFITMVPAGEAEGEHGAYTYTRKGSPLTVRAPDEPGAYELRYVSRLSRATLARLSVTVDAASATLEAPPAIGAGGDISVNWTGPDNQNDFITIVPVGAAEGEHGTYTYTRKGSPLTVRAPDEAGAYELRYVTAQSRVTLARLPIAVTEVTASVEAPPAIGAGGDITVNWTGPDNQNDFITIVPVGAAEGEHGTYTYTRKGSPLTVRAPDASGNYELRYVSAQSRSTLAALPIAVTEVTASLDAVPSANAGAHVAVTWTGPDNQNDFITVVPAGEAEGKHDNYTYTRKGNPLKVRLPDTPGRYELRYVTAQSRETLARLPINAAPVTATLDARPVVAAGSWIEIAWSGPDNHNDYIAIAAPDQDAHQQIGYAYTRKGNPLKIKAPKESGSYELRYVTAQDKNVLARLPITVQ